MHTENERSPSREERRRQMFERIARGNALAEADEIARNTWRTGKTVDRRERAEVTTVYATPPPAMCVGASSTPTGAQATQAP